MRPDKKIWLLIAMFFAVCLTCFTLSTFVTDPAHALPTLYGDGLKNAFTFLYHCVYGHGIWFHGMNYPYGEHIMFTDGQPLLSVLLHTRVGVALAAMWLLIGLSYVLSVIYTYKIFLHYKVDHPVAIIFAGLVTVFSPQLLRLGGGHFAFSYVCIVPMLYYWTLQYHAHGKWRYCVYVAVFGLLIALLHLYYAALLLLWVGAYAAGYLLLGDSGFRKKLLHAAPLLVGAVLVVALVKLFVSATDPVIDRPSIPYGLFNESVQLHDVFTSVYSPVWVFMKDHHILPAISGGIRCNIEAYGYLGLVVLITVGSAGVAAVRRLLLRQRSFAEHTFQIWWFMAVSIVLFVVLMPALWSVPWAKAHLGFLSQFRTVSRFIWMPCYIVSVYAVVTLYQYSQRLRAGRGRYAGAALLVAAVVLWAVEAWGVVSYSRNVAAVANDNYKKYFSVGAVSWPAFLKEHGLAAGNFQAIIMLEFFHLGSEKLWISDPGTNVTLATKASLQLGLPIVDTRLDRTSLSQTRKQVKLVAGPYAGKPILQDITNNKPFLLLVYDHNILNDDESFLLTASDLVGQHDGCHVYACYPGRLAQNAQKRKEEIISILPYMSVADSCLGGAGYWFVDHMDPACSAAGLFGTGGTSPILQNDSVVALIPLKPASDSQEFEWSCWFLLSSRDYNSPAVFLEILDSAGAAIGYAELQVKQSVDNYGMWFRGAVRFVPGIKCAAIRCRLSRGGQLSYLAMDEILLRPVDALIVSKDDAGRVMVNNHLLVAGTGGR